MVHSKSRERLVSRPLCQNSMSRANRYRRGPVPVHAPGTRRLFHETVCFFFFFFPRDTRAQMCVLSLLPRSRVVSKGHRVVPSFPRDFSRRYPSSVDRFNPLRIVYASPKKRSTSKVSKSDSSCHSTVHVNFQNRSRTQARRSAAPGAATPACVRLRGREFRKGF